MKIDFGTNKQASIDSLHSRAKSESLGFVLYIVGSQIMLRARLAKFPQQAQKINAILKGKDLDPRFEPMAAITVNIIELRDIAEQLNKNLLTKVEKKLPKSMRKEDTPQESKEIRVVLPDLWDSHYALPKDLVKHAVENQLDPSVQAKRIEPCMSIDLKSDHHGDIQYASNRQQHDFEVTYLEDNRIVLYDLDVKKLNDAKEQIRVAFMIHKCLKPELTEFDTLLTSESAAFIYDLLQDDALKYAKDKIFGILLRHYERDIAASEASIKELCVKSMQSEIERLIKEIEKSEVVLSKMLSTIEGAHGEPLAHRDRLTDIMSRSSGQSLKGLQAHLEAITEFKNELFPLYDKISQKEAAEQFSNNNTTLNKPLNSIDEEADDNNASDSKKKKKKKKPKNENNPSANITNSDKELELALREQALENAKPMDAITEFKILLNKYSTTLRKVSPVAITHEKGANPATINAYLGIKTVDKLFDGALNNIALEEAAFSIIKYLHRAINKDNVTTLPKKLLALLKDGDLCFKSLITSYSAWKLLFYLNQDLPGRSKAADYVQEYPSSVDSAIAMMLDIVIDTPAYQSRNAMEACVDLLINALCVCLLEEPKSASIFPKMLRFLDLYADGFLFLQYKGEPDIINSDFANTVICALTIKSCLGDQVITSSLVKEFLSNTIQLLWAFPEIATQLIIEILIIRSARNIIKAHFPNDGFTSNDSIVEYVKTLFGDELELTNARFAILCLCVPLPSSDATCKLSESRLSLARQYLSKQPGSIEALCKSTLTYMEQLMHQHSDQAIKRLLKITASCVETLMHHIDEIPKDSFYTDFKGLMAVEDNFPGEFKVLLEERPSVQAAPFSLNETQKHVIALSYMVNTNKKHDKIFEAINKEIHNKPT